MKINKKFFNVESIVTATVLIVMLALVFVGVLSRYIFHFSISFTEELVCTMFVLLSTMGGALASKENGHYTLDLVTGMMKPETKKIFMLIDTTLTALAAGILCYTGVQMVMSQMRMGSVSIALRIPNWIYGSCVPLGLIFIIFRSIEFIIKTIKTDPEAEKEASEE